MVPHVPILALRGINGNFTLSSIDTEQFLVLTTELNLGSSANIIMPSIHKIWEGECWA